MNCLTRFVLQISDWFQNTGSIYLSRTELGHNIESAQSISTEHDLFEQDSMRVQGDLLQLVRTSEQLSHTASVDVSSLRQRLQAVDDLAQNFMMRMDERRKCIATAIRFYRLVSQVSLKPARHYTATQFPALVSRHVRLYFLGSERSGYITNRANEEPWDKGHNSRAANVSDRAPVIGNNACTS